MVAELWANAAAGATLSASDARRVRSRGIMTERQEWGAGCPALLGENRPPENSILPLTAFLLPKRRFRRREPVRCFRPAPPSSSRSCTWHLLDLLRRKTSLLCRRTGHDAYRLPPGLQREDPPLPDETAAETRRQLNLSFDAFCRAGQRDLYLPGRMRHGALHVRQITEMWLNLDRFETG